MLEQIRKPKAIIPPLSRHHLHHQRLLIPQSSEWREEKEPCNFLTSDKTVYQSHFIVANHISLPYPTTTNHHEPCLKKQSGKGERTPLQSPQQQDALEREGPQQKNKACARWGQEEHTHHITVTKSKTSMKERGETLKKLNENMVMFFLH